MVSTLIPRCAAIGLCCLLLLGGIGEAYAQRRTRPSDPKLDAAKRDATKRDVVERPFGDGPLTFDDFQAEAPEGKRGANLVADVRYQYTYALNQEAGEYVARLTNIDLFAMAIRHRSWIYDEQDEKALQYPQGHFEIVQVASLRCKKLLLEKLLEGETFAGRAKDQQDAIAAMEQSFQKAMQPIIDDRFARQQKYYEAVGGGEGEVEETIKSERKKLLEELSTLEAELKKLTAKLPRRRR